MGKETPPRRDDIDIFADPDLAQVQNAVLEEPQSPPKSEGHEAERGGKATEEKDEGTNPDQYESAKDPEDEVLKIEPTDAEVRIRVRPSTREEFDGFRADFGKALGGVRLDDSVVGRAVIGWFLNEMSSRVIGRAEKAKGQLQRPSRHDPVALAAFDDELRSLIAKAIRHS